jgi:hypothetical protein
MGESAKQLTNTVAMSRTARVTRRAIGGGNAQRVTAIGEVRKLGIFAQAREHATTSVGNNEFECALSCTIRDQSASGPAAMFKDIVLQFTECAHQTRRQAFGQTSSYGGVLGMLGPLIPERIVSVLGSVKPTQGEHTGAIVSTGTADHAVGQRLLDLAENWRLQGYAAVGIRRRSAGDREFDERAYKSGSDEDQRRQLRQTTSNGLPQEVINCVKGCARA